MSEQPKHIVEETSIGPFHVLRLNADGVYYQIASFWDKHSPRDLNRRRALDAARWLNEDYERSLEEHATWLESALESAQEASENEHERTTDEDEQGHQETLD